MLKNTITHEQKQLTSNQVATLQIPAYGKIFSLPLGFFTSAGAPATEAAIRAEIGNIRMTVNGKDIVNASAAKILDLYEFLGVHVDVPTAIAGYLELIIGRLAFSNNDTRELFGLGTANVANIQIQVTAGTLSTIASVQAFTKRTAQSENFGMHCRYIDYPISYNSTGQNTVDTLPRDPDSAYMAVMTDVGSSGVISLGECRVNNVTIVEAQPTALNALYASNDGYAQPTGYFVYNFLDSSLYSFLPMLNVSDLRFLTTFTTAPGAAGYHMTALTVHGLPPELAAKAR